MNKKICPSVWCTPGEIGKINIEPIKVTFVNLEFPIRVKQYPIPLDGRRGLKPVIDELVKQGSLEACISPHNTPILPVKKSDGIYHLVQDLRAINQQTVTRFPVVANPYMLLSQIPPDYIWYSVVDLKDALWACPFEEGSQDYFAFEWEDPELGTKQQLRWFVLPQGFAESPNLFCQALEKVLQDFE
ncbi:hypothetical protein HGM15179_021958 [Zosterops borbonicus]|uniref:Reverse transcriptase domain-containing protein n=1 Tax=Zosterops borbonicus TaxID=364589 RepID=A0A8K1D6P1_9PASS|nr:hypothetical protein HGM15179_021958 [Zosterops borbonicus]